jgi:C4-dicarboxylate transporter DctM subunit
MALLPIAEIALRGARTGIPGSSAFVQHLTLVVTFFGAALAAREGKLLALATNTFIPEGRPRDAAHAFSSMIAAAIAALLCRAGLELVLIEREAGTVIAAGIPVWIAQLVIPIAFAVIAFRLAWRAGRGWAGRAAGFAGVIAGALIGQFPMVLEGRPAWPALAVIALGTLLGGPLFALLGGAAVVLFMASGIPMAAVPVETYRLAVNPTLPAIPLFTLTGILLAEGRSSTRLLRVFRALVGWMPGGTAVVCAAACSFFTAFTGGSGITILALGALLYQALRQDRYGERFSLGLLTASGSLGLLFAPALPLILYGIVAGVPIDHLFIGGALPGILMLGLAAAWGVREGIVSKASRTPFRAGEVLGALNEAKWELLLPAFVLVAILGGFATPVEASALSVLYAFVVQVFVHRDLSLRRDMGRVLYDCGVLVGGVMIILAVAMGFTSYLVDAEVPARLLEWTRAQVHSPLVFLLYLNLFLIAVGCLMDIFSAIVVVVPLIVPISQAFGIHPVHLGIIFIANLELGYLTPPVGLNLYLSSYRFNKPLLEVARATLPMILILLIGVLVITYVPWLTTGLLEVFGRG